MMLYLHIPFCVRKCAYCDFVSYAGQADKIARYVEALLAEMDRRPCAGTVTRPDAPFHCFHNGRKHLPFPEVP